MGGDIMAENTKPLFSAAQEEVRTSATVFKEDLQKFKALARLKFDKDPMNNAWKEAMSLFIKENKNLFEEIAGQIPDKKE